MHISIFESSLKYHTSWPTKRIMQCANIAYMYQSIYSPLMLKYRRRRLMKSLFNIYRGMELSAVWVCPAQIHFTVSFLHYSVEAHVM